jgi:hypothetical protein
MPAKRTGVGGNALARSLASLTVADDEAGMQVEPLGLEAAQAQEEEARRKMAELGKEAQKIEQQMLRQHQKSTA